MARKKKVDSQEKMEKKGLEMKPFTISCERHKNMAIVRIAECKDFKLMLATWDEELQAVFGFEKFTRVTPNGHLENMYRFITLAEGAR